MLKEIFAIAQTLKLRDEIKETNKKTKWFKATSGKAVSEGEEEKCEYCGHAHAVGKDTDGGYEPHPEEMKYHPDSDDSYWDPKGSPSVSEAKNPEFLSTVIDREIENLLKSKKIPMDRKDEVARVYKRGFRDGFSGGSSDSTGVKPGDLPIFNDGQEMGKKARKQAEKDGVEIPKMRLSNRLGERKANPAFDKLVNSYFTPPSKVAESKDQENQDVASYIDQYEEDGGADLEEDELDKSIEMFLKKKGYTSFDFPRMKKRIIKALGEANDWVNMDTLRELQKLIPRDRLVESVDTTNFKRPLELFGFTHGRLGVWTKQGKAVVNVDDEDGSWSLRANVGGKGFKTITGTGVKELNTTLHDLKSHLGEKDTSFGASLLDGEVVERKKKVMSKGKMVTQKTATMAEGVKIKGFQGYDMDASNPDDAVSVEVYSNVDDDSYYDDYHGINVVFRPGKEEPELHTADKKADAEARTHKKEIIEAARKKIMSWDHAVKQLGWK